MRTQQKTTRIDMRAEPHIRQSLELAAFLGGYASLSEFILETAEERANEIFHNLEHRPLSDRDRDLLLKILDKSPAPNEKLKAAFSKVNASYRSIGNTIVQQIDNKLFKKSKKEQH